MPTREEKLFARWSAGRDGFVRDGIVDEAAYAASNPRILFVLKETNEGPNDDHDLRAFLRGGGRSQTWDNVVRWARAIREPVRDWSWDDAERVTPEQRSEVLRTLAVMNIKKVAGGARAEGERIDTAAREDREFLSQQVELYEPRYIIAACGEGRYVPQLDGEGWLRTKRGMWYRPFDAGWGRALGLAVPHPQAQYPHHLMFFAVLDAIREIGREL